MSTDTLVIQPTNGLCNKILRLRMFLVSNIVHRMDSNHAASTTFATTT